MTLLYIVTHTQKHVGGATKTIKSGLECQSHTHVSATQGSNKVEFDEKCPTPKKKMFNSKIIR